MKRILRDEKGFTLIEMMIVVAIIAILSAVAIPKFNESLALTNTTRVQARFTIFRYSNYYVSFAKW